MSRKGRRPHSALPRKRGKAKEPVRVGPDMLVTVAYRLYDQRGEKRDEVGREAPLRYLHGYAQIIPGLERVLAGGRPGERRTAEFGPEEAFGERDEAAVLEIDRRDFPGGDRAEVGDEIQATAPDGSECGYRIVAVTDTDIVADRNHPLAGQRVRFEAVILAVRPAREHEIAAAQAEMDERIVGAGTIVYGSGPTGAEQLVTLRVKDEPRT